MIDFSQVFSLIGATVVLIAFFMLQVGKWQSDSRGYLILGMIGAGILLSVALSIGNWGFLILNTCFLSIGGWKYYRTYINPFEAKALEPEAVPTPSIKDRFIEIMAATHRTDWEKDLHELYNSLDEAGRNFLFQCYYGIESMLSVEGRRKAVNALTCDDDRDT